MSSARHRWRRTAAAGAVVAGTALVGTGLLATSASAHTPTWSVDCSTVKIDLTAYNARVTNTVSVSEDGKSVLDATKFGSEFHKTLDIPAHTKPVSVHLVIKAGDGDQYSRDETKTSPVCANQGGGSAPPTPTKSSSPSEAPTASAPSSSATSSAPAVVPTSSNSPTSNLADTGSSSSTPIIAGVAGAVVVAGAGMVYVARRRRPAARH